MTLLTDASAQMIEEFGVTVTVTPHDPQEPEDADNPVFFQESSTQSSSFEEKVRLYTAASDDMLQEYGFESDGDSIIYNNSDVISEGDEIAYSGMEYIVRNTNTNQMNDAEGQYLWVYELVEK